MIFFSMSQKNSSVFEVFEQNSSFFLDRKDWDLRSGLKEPKPVLLTQTFLPGRWALQRSPE